MNCIFFVLVDLSGTIMGWGSDSEPYVGRVSASYSSGRRPGKLRRDGETQLLPVGTDRKGGGDKLVKKQAYCPTPKKQTKKTYAL